MATTMLSLNLPSVIAFPSICSPAITQNHLHCVEHSCRYSNSNAVQNNIVYVKAAAKNWLHQLNPQRSHKAGYQSPHPCAVLLEQRVEDAKGKKHHDIAQVLRSEVVEEVRDKVVFKGEPSVASPAGRMVKEKVVDVPNNAVEKCQTQRPCDIADEKRREDNLVGGTPPVSPDLTGRIDSPGNQRDRECLQKETLICAEKEVLKIHIIGKVHEDASSNAM